MERGRVGHMAGEGLWHGLHERRPCGKRLECTMQRLDGIAMWGEDMLHEG